MRPLPPPAGALEACQGGPTHATAARAASSQRGRRSGRRSSGCGGCGHCGVPQGLLPVEPPLALPATRRE
eukprot:159890-Alexandrium_andersonii.AAC.1